MSASAMIAAAPLAVKMTAFLQSRKPFLDAIGLKTTWQFMNSHDAKFIFRGCSLIGAEAVGKGG